jgi:hypothetical protein
VEHLKSFETNLIKLRLVVGAVSEGSGKVLLLEIDLPDVPLLVLHAVFVNGILGEDVDLNIIIGS